MRQVVSVSYVKEISKLCREMIYHSLASPAQLFFFFFFWGGGGGGGEREKWSGGSSINYLCRPCAQL